jgi:hypothetical protein
MVVPRRARVLLMLSAETVSDLNGSWRHDPIRL